MKSTICHSAFDSFRKQAREKIVMLVGFISRTTEKRSADGAAKRRDTAQAIFDSWRIPDRKRYLLYLRRVLNALTDPAKLHSHETQEALHRLTLHQIYTTCHGDVNLFEARVRSAYTDSPLTPQDYHDMLMNLAQSQAVMPALPVASMLINPGRSAALDPQMKVWALTGPSPPLAMLYYSVFGQDPVDTAISTIAMADQPARSMPGSITAGQSTLPSEALPPALGDSASLTGSRRTSPEIDLTWTPSQPKSRERNTESDFSESEELGNAFELGQQIA